MSTEEMNTATKDFLSGCGSTRSGSAWDTVLRGVSRTVEFLEEERIFDAKRLPSDVVIPLLVALWGLAPIALDAEGRARTLLRKYLWRAFFSNRYERSTNSRSLADFIQLKSLLSTTTPAVAPDIFDDVKHPLPQIEELVDAGLAGKQRAGVASHSRFGLEAGRL
jgi:hypothetical protein